MELHLSEGRIPVGYARFGSIWKKGEVTETDFRLRNEAGEEVPVQSKAAAFWPDGSIKWAFHEADSARMGKQVRLTCHGEEAVKQKRQQQGRKQKTQANDDAGRDLPEMVKPRNQIPDGGNPQVNVPCTR